MYCRYISVIIMFIVVTAVHASSVLAADDSPVGKDKFKLSAGIFLPAINSELKISSKSLGTGTNIDLESDLGLDEDITSGRAQGYWRFAPRHRLYFGYYGFDRDASHTLSKEITINDKIFDVGAELYTSWEIDFISASYAYSFYQGEKMELSGSLGLYYLRNKFTFHGRGYISGELEVEKMLTEEESLDLPIPIFGLAAEYYFTPKWRGIVGGSFFTIAIDEWDGTIYQLSASLEYLFHKNFGIGAGYSYFDVNVERDRSTRISTLDYTYGAAQVYGIWYF